MNPTQLARKTGRLVMLIGQNWVNDPDSLKYVKTSKHQAKITTSRKRYFRQHPEAISGANNPRWLGGITPASRLRLGKASWKRIKSRVLKRDGQHCVSCGNDKNLHVHHIISWRNDGKDVMENLQTLCNHCHMRLEMNCVYAHNMVR